MTEKVYVDPSALIESLRDKGVSHVFHANSVETSISFFRTGRLLSRGACVHQSLPMSQQYSDEKDQRYGIWNDLFFNADDFHQKFKNPNPYGPITFQMSIDHFEYFLKNSNSKVGITYKPPDKWRDDDNANDRWWRSPYPAMQSNYSPDIVVETTNEGCDLRLIDQVVIEELPPNPNYFRRLDSIFQTCLKAHGLDLKITQRSCKIGNCKCQRDHRNYADRYNTGKWKSDFGDVA